LVVVRVVKKVVGTVVVKVMMLVVETEQMMGPRMVDHSDF
jgi:hypothetical protein